MGRERERERERVVVSTQSTWAFTRRRLRRQDPRCCQTRLRLVVTELRSLERGERRDRPRRNWRCFRLTKLRMELLPRKHQQRSNLLQKPSASENKNFQKNKHYAR